MTAANLAVLAAAAGGYLLGNPEGTRPQSAAAAASAAGPSARRRPIPWELLAWPAVYFLFFTATRSSYILFTWYFLPVLPFLILFLVAGLARLAEAAREGRYKEAARLIDSLARPGETPLVMIDEVGAIGYWSHARILDTHGLLSPEALPFLGPAEGYFTRMAALQDRFDPEWILGMRLVRDEGLWYPGEDGMYSGYGVFRVLRYPSHPYHVEMWRRLAPD